VNDREPPSSSGDDEGDHLVTVRVCDSAFEAHALAAVLHDAEIEAWVFDTVTCVAMTGMTSGVPLQVRARDIDRAKSTLEQRIADSVDIDWDEVDVGEPDESEATGWSFGRHSWMIPLLLFVLGLMVIVVIRSR